MNKKTLLLFLLIPHILLAFCSTINAKENTCRHVAGDSWCLQQEDALKVFAYKDKCKGSSYKIMNKQQEDNTWKLSYVNLKTQKHFTITKGLRPIGYDWVSRDVILVSISCGSPCTNNFFQDLSTNQKFSSPLMIAYDEKYVANIEENGTVTIRELFGEVVFTDILNISSVASPLSTIEKASFKKHSLVVDYLTGKNFKSKQKTINFLNQKVLNYFTIENEISPHMKALYGKTEKKNIEIYSLEDGVCIELGTQKDFDNNGELDVLITHTACGGNGALNFFTIFLNDGHGHFKETEDFGYMLDEPSIEKWQGVWSVVVQNHSVGTGNEELSEVTNRYIIENGKLKKVESDKRELLSTIAERWSKDLKDKGIESSSKNNFYIDLNDDGKDEYIKLKYWGRWASMLWTVVLPDGSEDDHHSSCKRIGILKSKHKNMHDIVCNEDTIYEWNGEKYVEKV